MSNARRFKPEHLVPLLEKEGPVVLLESQSSDHPQSRKSYLAAHPEWILKVRGNRIVVLDSSRRVVRKITADPWEALRNFIERTDGWAFGYLGYDLKNYTERLSSANRDPVGAPDLYFINPGLILEWDGETLRAVKGVLDQETVAAAVESNSPCSISGFRPRVTEQAYREIIHTAQEKIREGEFYELNLTHQMEGDFTGRPFDLYTSMKEAGPVPFGAYLSFDEWRVCSSSPERFLAREGEKIYSQPIKGTVERGSSRSEDARLREWLARSEKNRAENLMIVDLVRNDLGKVARKGTVRTPSLFEIQSFGTVHQMVSTVEATAGDHHNVDIIKACFPMGSMTGAPKIRSMEYIEQLEDYRRGIYSGAIGYVRPNGDFDFNVVIRTAIIKESRLFYSVGGAITSDSDPAGEWEETLIKARALTSANPCGIESG